MREIGLNDNFFALGGHSLKAVQLTFRIKNALGDVLTLWELMRHPTIAEQARIVALRTAGVRWQIDLAPVAEHYPLSRAQRRLWLVDRGAGASAAYGMPAAFILSAEADLALVERALALLVQRHESLRTRLIVVDGEPRQVIDAPESMRVAGFPLDEVGLAAFIADEARRPFDLERDGLSRMLLVPLTDGRTLLFVNLHHILGDGWSFRVLHEDLLAFYLALRDGLDPPSPARLQYKDFAVWDAGRDDAEDGRYWRERLSPPPERVRLPYDFALPPMANGQAGATEFLLLPPETLAALKSFALAHSETLAAVALSVFFAFLARVTGQEDLAVALSVANRVVPESERMVGFFVNAVVVRQTVETGSEFTTLLHAVGSDLVGALDHQGYPFDELVQALAPRGRGGRLPFGNVAFAFQNFGDLQLGGRGGSDPLIVEARLASSETSKFDLSLFVSERESGLDLTFGVFHRIVPRGNHAPSLGAARTPVRGGGGEGVTIGVRSILAAPRCAMCWLKSR